MTEIIGCELPGGPSHADGELRPLEDSYVRSWTHSHCASHPQPTRGDAPRVVPHSSDSPAHPQAVPWGTVVDGPAIAASGDRPVFARTQSRGLRHLCTTVFPGPQRGLHPGRPGPRNAYCARSHVCPGT